MTAGMSADSSAGGADAGGEGGGVAGAGAHRAVRAAIHRMARTMRPRKRKTTVCPSRRSTNPSARRFIRAIPFKRGFRKRIKGRTYHLCLAASRISAVLGMWPPTHYPQLGTAQSSLFLWCFMAKVFGLPHGENDMIQGGPSSRNAGASKAAAPARWSRRRFPRRIKKLPPKRRSGNRSDGRRLSARSSERP